MAVLRGRSWKLPGSQNCVLNIEKDKKIGEGNFGVVYKGKMTNSKGIVRPVAIKEIEVQDPDEEIKEINAMIEVLKHENVTRLLASSIENSLLLILLEFCSHGGLKEYIDKYKSEFNLGLNQKTPMPFQLDTLVSWSRQIANGMWYLSEKKIVHCDLATRNILLCESNFVKISDFGLARKRHRTDGGDMYSSIYQKSDNAPRPIRWTAPEALAEGTYSTKSDVWSYGVVVWEILSLGKFPYEGVTDYSLATYLESGKRLPKPQYLSPRMYKELLLQCWDFDPEKRPDFQKIFLKLQQEV